MKRDGPGLTRLKTAPGVKAVAPLASPARRRPADECPFERPFDAGFRDCAAFQIRHLVVLDSQNRPLKPVWTCRHLESRQLPGAQGRYYGACRFGDAPARQRWAQAIGLSRIDAANQLRLEVMPLAQRFMDAIAVLKTRQVEGAAKNEDVSDIRLGMEALGQEYLAELDDQLKEQTPLLAQAQMPKKALLTVARHWVVEVIEDTWALPGWRQELPEELLARLPESVRAFYAPPV